MSLGLVVNYDNQRKEMSESQYVADLAAMFDRRRIALGDPHVCEQFEILLTTSDSFRSQLFTLCTAISHMSDSDLSGDELLDLIARALGTETCEGPALPEKLKKSFLSGLEAWSKRAVASELEWPPRKKPVANVPQMSAPSPSREAGPMAAEPAANPQPRPAGVRTLQEALELARLRGGDHPLGPEPVPAPVQSAEAKPAFPPEPKATFAPEPKAAAAPEPNPAAIQELNTLLAEIEERMKRLRPQLVSAETTSSLLHEDQPTLSSSLESLEAAFLERHPYLRRDRSKVPFQIQDISEAFAAAPEPVIPPPKLAVGTAQQGKSSAVAEAVGVEADSELRLIPRNFEEIEEPEEPGPPAHTIPDTMRFRTYLAIAVLAGIALVATPISGVLAYRYLHPLYIYDTAPKPAEAAPPAQSTGSVPAKSAKPAAKSSRSGRKSQPKPKPSVAVWPAAPEH